MRFDNGTDINRLASLEWIETNGLGGFASCTVAGMNSRRYHGLLTAATRPPVGRFVLLSKFEETLIIGEQRFELSSNQYPGAIHPSGFTYLREFCLDPFPTFIYEVEGMRIEKRIFMVHDENTAVIEYELKRDEDGPHYRSCSLELRPLIAFRDYHSLTHSNGAINKAVAIGSQRVTIEPYAGLPPLYVAHNAARIHITGDWYYNFEYRAEQERGLDFQEDLYNPFLLEFDLTNSRAAALIASTEQRSIFQVPAFREREIERRRALSAAVPDADEFVRRLTVAADQFVAKRGDLQTVIAGYHWFSDWGRDTMIALPGLTLVTGRFDTARKILKAFAKSVDQGMLPNRWPDAGEMPEYNTVDATLWFFEAIAAYLRYTGDYDFVFAELLEVCKDIIDWHLQGTRFGIHVNELGLLHCGESGTQLTWMDAKVGDCAITPRQGMPVEIQALWYNALRIMQSFALTLKDSAAEQEFGRLADRAQSSFKALFWNERAGCLFDVIDGEQRDARIRPNQIFTLSLTYPLAPSEWAESILNTVEKELLTSRGIRSLAPSDAAYRPHYSGGVWERDSAYHQGTVWSWLLGPFITAYMRSHGHSDAARERAKEWLGGIEAHLDEACISQISEIFDAAEPFTPRGCAAQAWSVGEILRATVEDVLRSTRLSKETLDTRGESDRDLAVLTV